MTAKINRGRLLLLAIGLVLIAATHGSAAAGPNATVTQVMSGLDNPRGLAFGPTGALYVAEAGRGGFKLEGWSCAEYPAGYGFTGRVGGARCYGPTGAISRLWHGAKERVASGLPSQARADNGGQAIGPQDIAMLGSGSAYVTVGLMQPPAWRTTYPFLSDFARLAQVEPGGGWRFVADPGAYEADPNPGGGLADTNPYGLLAGPHGHVLTDAGGNSLLQVDWNGDISTLAVFQSRPHERSTDSVPTTVAIGPDGAYYVGELTGIPVFPGVANVYRVAPGDTGAGEPPLLLADQACVRGLSTIIDIAFDAADNLYVLQYGYQDGLGSLLRITPDRDTPGGACAQYQAGARTTIRAGLSQPTSVVVGPDGALYVSNHGSSVLAGEVLRIEQ
jgi:hypothetical protein